MPLHHHNHHHEPPPAPKANPKLLLSSILKALIMTFITSVFFLFLGFVAFILFLILAAGALHRRRTTQFDPAFSVKNLPHFRFRAHRPTAPSASSPTDCVVCLDAFREGQCCRKLPRCCHVFHRKCLDTWLVKVSACPICRTPVWLGFGNEEEEEKAERPWAFNRNTNSRVW